MIARLSVVLLAALLVGGCGWQLRGMNMVALDGAQLWFESRINLPQVERELLRGLERAGAVIVDEREQADAVLVLLDEQVSRRASGLDSEARVQEYEMTYRLRFNVEGPDGEPWSAPEAVSVRRGYQYDQEDVLATEAREALLREDLQRDATRLLLSRAQATIGRRL